jgi:MOSC domain-containing protein YiiM
VQIRRLYISTGHNFFGRHEQEPGNHPMLECGQVECVAGRGIMGDRFFDFKPDYSGQITFFSWEVYERLCEALNVRDRGPSVFRRNAIVSDTDLNALIGCEFEVQGIRFLGRKECSPCYWMDRAFAVGAETFLKGQGGLRAAILTSGTLHVQQP